MRLFRLLLLVCPLVALAQPNRGELRLHVTDASGAVVPAQVELISNANGYRESVACDDKGSAALRNLPFGIYSLHIEREGFAPYSATVQIRSAVPIEDRVRLAVAAVETVVTVKDGQTLIDPASPSSVMQIGPHDLQQRPASLPGRSVQDLVDSQPGWLFEGSAVLHPRGTEYQTQFVVDGVPLTDNRSPGMGPAFNADDLESMSIYTAGYPAEYGRKMGGVVELNTRQQPNPGLHGTMALSGGTYDTISGYGELQESRSNNTLGLSASGARTSHYLNPVVPQNYTNSGRIGDVSARFQRDLDAADSISLNVRTSRAHYLIPNELIQQQAGQRQNADNSENMLIARYQHIASADKLLVLSGMLRDNRRDLDSNVNPYPIAAFQHNRFREAYGKGTWTVHHGRHEFKAGVESDNIFLRENFSYTLTDPSQFDEGTPASLAIAADRPELDQAAFAEDLWHNGQWTVSAGLRWDHYQLLLNRQALSPRLSVARFFQPASLLLHLSYDRVFQTPAFENILISSSDQVRALNSEFLRRPVQPSSGDDFEIGATKAFRDRLRIDANTYRRQARNFADDDQLLNTGVSYPITFDKGVIYGAESKLQLTGFHHFSGFVSYSWMLGQVWLPVTGGLFLGDDAVTAMTQLGGHLPNSQDQRNTLATRWQYAINQRATVAAGLEYGSGLPFEYGGTQEQALAQYGPDVVSRLDFARGRVRPNLSMNASLALNLLHREHLQTTLHVDGENLNDRLNVLDFGGLFSGNAIAPARSVLLHLETQF